MFKTTRADKENLNKSVGIMELKTIIEEKYNGSCARFLRDYHLLCGKKNIYKMMQNPRFVVVDGRLYKLYGIRKDEKNSRPEKA